MMVVGVELTRKVEMQQQRAIVAAIDESCLGYTLPRNCKLH